MKLAVNYLLDNPDFALGNICFQLIGIPKGSEPAPVMANLILYNCEKKWLLQRKKWDMWKACIFSNIFRFIDDLYTFNNDEFENKYNDICPDERELKKENEELSKPRFWTFL